MANGYPQFGGTNGVSVLDLGQPGGVRNTAGTALFTVNIMDNPDEVRTAEHELPQQNRTYVDVLGPRGKRVTWTGTIRTSTTDLMVTILRELDERKHGSGRDADGNLAAANPVYLYPTRLTDFDGNILCGRARLDDWHATDRRSRGNQWAAIQDVEIEFRCLG